jgi:hypothetical protein
VQVFAIGYTSSSRNGTTVLTKAFKDTNACRQWVAKHCCKLRRGIVKYAAAIHNINIALHHPATGATNDIWITGVARLPCWEPLE